MPSPKFYAPKSARVSIPVLLAALAIAGCTATVSKNNTPSQPGTPAISVGVSPTTSPVQVGKGQSFTATVANDSQNEGVTWALSGAGCSSATCGTLSAGASASGTAITYTAPGSVPSPATVTLTATSVADTTKSSAAAITVTSGPAIVVNVAPTTGSVQVTQTLPILGTVMNDAQNEGLTWTVSGAGCSGVACGTVTPTSTPSGSQVNYIAPAQVPSPATVTVTATSVADSTKSARATITVTSGAQAGIGVTVAPTSTSVTVNLTQPFAATVMGDSQNEGVKWTLSDTGVACNSAGAPCGTVTPASSPSGSQVNYIAPAQVPSPAMVTVTATSVADPTKSASATVTVAAASTCTGGSASGVTISPVRGSVPISQSLPFIASVANDTCSQGVTWTASTGTFSAQTTGTATYVAAATAGTVTITATSITDTTKSASAKIGVTDLAGVTTYRYDLSRDGVNAKEYALTTSSVNTATFGKLFTCSVDGSLFAQTLWVPNLTINGTTHNVVFAASAHDTVYAFDADASPCITLWSKSLLGSGETWLNGPNDTGIAEIFPDVGIVGTPVIDPVAKIMYVVAKSKQVNTTCTSYTACSCVQRLHALSLIDGTEKAGGPVSISPTLITIAGSGEGGDGTTVPFDPLRQNQRPGLALVNGTVYIGWGSHGDLFMWHGWLVGFNASNIAAAPTIYNTTRNGRQGSIWMAGGAPAADSNNNLYVVTANGDWDGVTDFSDSLVKFSTSGGLSVSDWFTPWNQATLDAADSDVGSGGAVVLVDLPATSPIQHLLIGGGKGDDGNSGKLYLLNRDNMGHYGVSSAQEPNVVVQEFSFGQSIYGTLAFWQNTAYFAGANGPINAFALNSATSKFNTTPTSATSTIFYYPGSSPAISSTGTSNGVVWSMDNNGFVNGTTKTTGPTILHAFDATNLATELWNSSMVATDNATGVAVKFTVPTVANGKVYIGSSQEVDVYGLKPN